MSNNYIVYYNWMTDGLEIENWLQEVLDHENLELISFQDKMWVFRKVYPDDFVLNAERRWIPVSERLPESGFVGLCQVAGNGYVIARYAPYDSEGGWTSDEIGYCFVTHWMPLPEPPDAS